MKPKAPKGWQAVKADPWTKRFSFHLRRFNRVVVKGQGSVGQPAILKPKRITKS